MSDKKLSEKEQHEENLKELHRIGIKTEYQTPEQVITSFIEKFQSLETKLEELIEDANEDYAELQKLKEDNKILNRFKYLAAQEIKAVMIAEGIAYSQLEGTLTKEEAIELEELLNPKTTER